jgi:hypothetical protein
MMYLFSGLAIVGALFCFFVMEAKIFALILSGVAALFLVLQFTQEFNSKANAVDARFDAAQASFNVEFAKARGEDKKTITALQERSDNLQTEADQAKANQKLVEAQNEAIRKPLVDALNRQVSNVSQDEASPITLKK